MWIILQQLKFCQLTGIVQPLNRHCSKKSTNRIGGGVLDKRFGPVIRQKCEIQFDDDIKIKSELPPVTQYQNKYTTFGNKNEYHWLIQRQPNSKFVQVFRNPNKVEKKTKSVSATKAKQQLNDQTLNRKSSFMQRISPASQKSVVLSAANFLSEFIVSNRNSSNVIEPFVPFDDDGLKKITNYPIMCDKASENDLTKVLSASKNNLPSISKILQATMPESARIALNKWKQAKIAELGWDGFKQYEQETLQIGKDFHLAIEEFLQNGIEPDSDSSIIKLWKSLRNDLKTLKPNPVLIEKPVVHPILKYKGIIDNVSLINNELCAMEWKTSEKSKPYIYSTYDAPIQLCAYIGALNIDPRYDMKVQNGYVVVAYKNGKNANLFRLTPADMRKYWLIWLQRVQEYWTRLRDGTLPEPI